MLRSKSVSLPMKQKLITILGRICGCPGCPQLFSVQSIALRTTYCRVLPRYLKKLGPRYQRLVVFANAEKRANKKSCQEPNW